MDNVLSLPGPLKRLLPMNIISGEELIPKVIESCFEQYLKNEPVLGIGNS